MAANSRPAAYAIKAAVSDLAAARFAFGDQKTMYGGKGIGPGDRLFLFASETAGGAGLFAAGTVIAAEPTPRRPGVARQTPRVSITVERTAFATAPLGRTELKRFRGVDDGSAEAELDFKLYRQATDKIVGLTDEAAGFLESRVTAV